MKTALDQVPFGQNGDRPKKIWIDLENSPHVPFFKPIIEELEGKGFSVIITARDCFQVLELAELLHVPCKMIGRHYGKMMLAKVAGLFMRGAQLLPYVLRERPDLAVSHGSRSLFVVATLLRIPTITIFDYEHVRWQGFQRDSWAMAPEIIPDSAIGIGRERLLRYPGIKEDVYAPAFRPDPGLRRRLKIEDNELLVTLRPPATEAHYHNPESEKLLDAVFTRIANTPHTKVVLLPRTPKQEEELRQQWPDLFREGKIVVPEHAIDGMGLIWLSDVVISGGGTMNRESAALGVPVYSIFRGRTGAVDKYLAETGRLVLLESQEDVQTKLHLVRRARTKQAQVAECGALQSVVGHIARLAAGAA